MFIKKYLDRVKEKFILLCLISVAAGCTFYMYVEKKAQQYVATAIIEYNTEDGNAPDGTEIDTTEITSSEVISRACEDIGENVSADQIRSGISIDSIVDSEEQALYEAKLEHGEEYEIIKKRYKITFSAENGSTKSFPRKVLNAVLQEYFDYYGKYHSSVNGAVNDVDNLNTSGSYDYIEMMDIINNSLDSAMETLSSRVLSNSSFRSSTTGYTFQDLYDEISYLRNTKSPIISAQILSQKATKDAGVLVATYEKKNSDLDIESDGSKEKAERLEEIIDTYVSMMKNSGNANLDDEDIIQDVSDTHGVDTWNSKADKTTEYDTLLTNWITATSGYKRNEIEYAYNEYIINLYSDVKDSNEVESIETDINDLLTEINSWFNEINQTMNDYNAVLGAENVSMLTNVTISEKISGKSYSVMIMMAAFIGSLIVLALVMRIQEMLEMPEESANEQSFSEESNLKTDTIENT